MFDNKRKKVIKVIGTLIAMYGIILVPLISSKISPLRLGAIAVLSIGMIISVIIEIKKINKEFD